jgi:hypothetical protein
MRSPRKGALGSNGDTIAASLQDIGETSKLPHFSPFQSGIVNFSLKA